MKFLRSRFVGRTIAIFLLLVFAQSLFLPMAAKALSNGPEQIEYSSFESPGATDLVNLITGDFAYTLPLMEVPGPEGSFNVPIFYHAGIMPEQDASWTGLGFNINVGSITRSVVGYHDDAYDNTISVNVNDPGGSAWVKNYVFYKRTFDSERGYGGGVSLLNIVGAEWNSSGLTTGTAMGLNFNKSGIRGSFVENVFNFANAVGTVASLGTAAAGGFGTFAKALATDMAVEAGMTAMTTTRVSSGLSQGIFASQFFNWDRSTKVSNLGFRQDYKYWLDDTRIERGFGSLYLGSTEKTSLTPVVPAPDYNQLPSYKVGSNYPRVDKAPFDFKPSKGFVRNSSGDLVASDMYLNVLPGENYSSVVRPSHISFDKYNVMSSGVGGQISPYRLEMGTVALPKRYSQYHISHNLIPFIEEDNTANKVQFYYDGQFSNKYLYHDDPSFGITHSTYVAPTNTSYDKQDVRYMKYSITNDKFLGGDRTEVDASRINGKKVVSGKNVEWFTNEEITSGAAAAKGFIDVQNTRPTFAPKGIGGFSITKEDGVTYHYALPVYKTSEIDLVGKKNEEEVKYSRAVNQNPIAISWLLTGITGPDFIDRGTSGQIDDQDWGYWIKFNYGLTSSNYDYRFPYYGYHDDGTSLSYSQGKRDQYYLNSVETRSHKALFIKGVRTDGLSSYLKKNDPNFGHNTESGLATPTPPLFLDEIVLLTKANFTALSQLGFSEVVNSSLGFAGLSANNGTLANVYDIGDIQANSSFRSFIDINATKRIKLVYETDESLKLCKKSLNSFIALGNPPAVDESDVYANKQGKLTLRRIQYLGRNNQKIIPDYKFEYAYNPDYNKYYWDGWGYYNPNGTSSMSSHKTSQTDQDGSAWSLTKITLPTGGSIQIDYERDSYSSISGERTISSSYSYGSTNTFYYPGEFPGLKKIYTSDAGSFSVNEKVKLTGQVTFTCPVDNSIQSPPPYTQEDMKITQVGSNYIIVENPYLVVSNCNVVNSGTPVQITNSGTISKYEPNKKGGDIRVSQITLMDESGQSFKTKYNYTLDNNSSSGVVAKEPELIKENNNVNNFGLDNVYDYPTTPVLYSMVTVQSIYNPVSNDYAVKQVFEFETPNKNMVVENTTQLHDYLVPGLHYRTGNDLESDQVYFKQYLHKIDVKTSKIGKIKSIKTYDKNNVLNESTIFDYIESTPSDQGKYTAGVILSEIASTTSSFLDAHVMKLIKSTKTYYPYVLSKITYSKDGFTNTKEYKAWDFFTGIPTITVSSSADNFKIRQEVAPAYSIQYSSGGTTIKPYETMGLKGFNLSNKNMVSQIARSYTYRADAAGNSIGLIGASIQSWRKDWNNYRFYDTSTGTFSDADDEPAGTDVWRKGPVYIWKGSYSKLNPDGTHNFLAGDEFNFSPSGSNPLWQYVGEVLRYDHYSMPLETKDLNNIYAANKMGHKDVTIAEGATNAKFNEIAFSSAEDLYSDKPFFGGEVGLGNGSVKYQSKGQTTATHTGDAVVALSSGYAFIYKTSNLEANKRYRSAVWTNNTNGRIYYKINGGGETLSSAPTSSKLANGWYRIDVELPVQGSVFSLEIGVKSASGEVYFDDFRFQPVDASMACQVSLPQDFQFTAGSSSYLWLLDNDNFYTKFEHNERGLLTKTYQESFKYGVKQISESKDNYRRFNINQ